MKNRILYTGIFCLLLAGSVTAQNFNGRKIYVDPGHDSWGANDRGLATINYPQGNTLSFWESSASLKKGLALQKWLVEANAIVYMSRTTQIEVDSKDVTARAAEASSLGVNMLWSLHSNAFNSSTNYPLVIFRSTSANKTTPVYPEARTLGQAVWPKCYENTLSSWTYNTMNVRGDCDVSVCNLGVLGCGRMACLLEGTFHDYGPERHRLMSQAYCAAEAWNVLRGFCAYYGLAAPSKGAIVGFAKDQSKSISASTVPARQDAYNTTTNGPIRDHDLYFPINGCKVELISGTSVIDTYTTDGYYNGIFGFFDVNPGTYKLRLTAAGYNCQEASVTVGTGGYVCVKQYLTAGSAVCDGSTDTGKQPNIYAYDLKGGTVNRATKQVTVSYKLNAAASSVVFDVPGYTVVSTSTVGLTAGIAHSVTLTLNSLPAEDADLTWSVTATGAAASPTSPTRLAPSVISDEGYTPFSTADAPFKLFSPRNVAVDNNFDSPYFGNAYVVNGNGGLSPSSTSYGTRYLTTERGIYIYTPLLQRNNFVSSIGTTAVTQPAYAGGVGWDANFESPFGVAVGPDGMVYVTDGRKAGIHRMNPANPGANFTTVITGTGTKPFCWVTDTNIYAMNIGAFTIDENANYTSFSNVIEEYPVSGGTKTKDIFNYSTSGVTITNRITGIAPGINGGWWITQGGRQAAGAFTASNPRSTSSLIYINAAGTVLYNSVNDAAIHALFNTIGTGSVGSIAVSPDGQYLAVAPFRNSQKIRILSVNYGVGDTPTLTNLPTYEVTTGSGGTSSSNTVLTDYSGLAFDRANNLFTTTAGDEWVKVYALPKAGGNIATTPAPASQPIVVGGPLPDVPTEELWNFSIAKNNLTPDQASANSDFAGGHAVSIDGTELYFTVRSAATNHVAVYRTSDGIRTGYLPNVPGWAASTAGDVAVDGNGAIYASNITTTATGVLRVAKWVNSSATPTLFISTVVDGSAQRVGYGMDVYVDKSGNGFLLMHQGHSGTATQNIYYWEIANNAAKSQAPFVFNATNTTATRFARISIVDKNNFWLDGADGVPQYCTITRAAGSEYGNPTGISRALLSPTTNIAVAAAGASEFNFAGKPYLAVGGTQHGVQTDFPGIGHYIFVREKITANTTGGTSFGPLPAGGLGTDNGSAFTGGVNATHGIKPVVYVDEANDCAYIYILGTYNGIAGIRANAVKKPVLTPAPGKYSVDEFLEVNITTATAGATIKYTLDGSDPATSSTALTYSADNPVTIAPSYSPAKVPIALPEGTVTIKLLATKDGQLFPNVSEATYEIDTPTSLEKVKLNYSVIPTPLGIEIRLDGKATIELFTVGGQLIEKTTASSIYSRNLANGVYIVRINGKVVKFVR